MHFAGSDPGAGREQPRIVTVWGGDMVDITTKGLATVRDITESGRAGEHMRSASGAVLGSADTILAKSVASELDPALPARCL